MTGRDRIYIYKLTCDNGGAPCVHDNLLSLAICKPMIRRSAKPGDLIFGFAANSLHADNRLIYAAALTDNLSCGAYFLDERFIRRPDCIYALRRGRFYRRPGARFHHGPGDIIHDLGEHYERANVLISNDFRYFGRDGKAEYKKQFGLIKEAVERLGRGYRVNHHHDLRAQLCVLKQQIWKSTRQADVGTPTSSPTLRVSHRCESCGAVTEKESSSSTA